MANQLVASSSLPPSWRYHVFLSFRGEDIRTNFTDHLYHALVDKEIKTFIDRDLQRGEEISLSLLKTIEESRIALVIFSQNYASSRWCLEELVKIHQCRESKQQIILPVFYKVDPSHVRNQRGCYGDAFIGHERKFEDQEMVLMWRRALTEVANLSGYHVKEEDSEATKISNIVKDILDRIPDGTYLKGSHLPKKSTYQLQITLDGYDFYEGEPFRDSQRVLRKSYDVWDYEIKQQQKILALRSNNNNKYLRYIHQRIENLDGLVQFSKEDVRSKYAKFQIEPAGSGYGGLVHIKCCFNKKYLRRANDRQYWIVAGANEPEEDKKHWSCTLFTHVVVHSKKKGVFRLLHVQLGHFVKSFTVNEFNQCLFTNRNTPDLHNDMDVYTVVDLEPLLLPSPFVLKSNNNNKYLRYIHQCIENLDGLVQFSEED